MANARFVHISDLHVGLSESEEVRSKRILDSIARNYAGVPVLITGDLTDSANLHQMQTVKRLLDILAATNPVLVVPGNHDYAWKGNFFLSNSVENWNKYLGYTLGQWPAGSRQWMLKSQGAPIDGLGIVVSGDLVFVGVDSGDPQNHERTARGYISSDLASILEKELDRHAGKNRVVFLHHHVFDNNLFMALEGAEGFLKAVGGRCEVLLFGHDHHIGIWRDWSGKIPFAYASHKSTDTVCGEQLMISIVEIEGIGSGARVWQRLELA
jgi:3',5'-cyclic-AMP phosphodiesterase